MIPINPGNLLKFHNFNAKQWQSHRQPGQDRHPSGLRAPNTRLLPFQIFKDSGSPGDISWRLLKAVNDGTSGAVSLSAGHLSVIYKLGGGFWVLWYAADDLGDPPECGFWYIELTINEQVYYSEIMHLFADNEPTPIWRMKFKNTLDKDIMLYQYGFEQYFYPRRWSWDRPVIDRSVNEVEDGYGNIVHRFTRTVDRFRVEVSDLPDYAIPFFSKTGDLDTVEFQDAAGDIAAVPMKNISFTFRAQGDGLNIGVFTFDTYAESFNGCQENFQID